MIKDEEIEDVVLGGLMIDGHALMSSSNLLGEECFDGAKNKSVYKAIIDLFNENAPVDILTVVNRLRENEELETAGGVGRISELTSRVASTANMEHHIFILRQLALKRKIMKDANEMFGSAREFGSDPFELIDGFVQGMEKFTASMVSPSRDIVQAAKNVEQWYNQIASGVTPAGSVLTHIPELDDAIIRIEPGENVVLAGRPGMGKTAVALKICLNLALKGLPVAYFSAEMNEEELVKRLAIYLTGVNGVAVKTGKLNSSQEQLFKKGLEQISRLPIHIVNASGVTIERQMGILKGLHKRHLIKLAVADYCQLFTTNRKLDGEQRYSEISTVWNNTIKSLKLPGILLSQLARKVEDAPGSIPQLHHLLYSGKLEADANIVIMLYRPEYYGLETVELGGVHEASEGLLVGFIRKHRDGTQGIAKMRWNKGSVGGEVDDEDLSPF